MNFYTGCHNNCIPNTPNQTANFLPVTQQLKCLNTSDLAVTQYASISLIRSYHISITGDLNITHWLAQGHT